MRSAFSLKVEFQNFIGEYSLSNHRVRTNLKSLSDENITVNHLSQKGRNEN